MEQKKSSSAVSTPRAPDTVLSALLSTINTAVLLASIVIVAGIVWYGGCYFGQPLGRIVTRILPPKEDELMVQEILGGVIAIAMCGVAFLKEDFAAHQRGDANSEKSRMDFVLLAFKVLGGGLGAVAILGEIAKATGLS